MKKFILFLLVPLMMVTSVFAFELEAMETDYDGEDVKVEFVDCEDGTFRFVISNYRDETIFVNYEDSFFCALDDDWEEIDGTQTLIFSEDEVDEDADFIDGGMFLASEPYYMAEDIELAGYYIAIEIDDEEYTWTTVISDYYED